MGLPLAILDPRPLRIRDDAHLLPRDNPLYHESYGLGGLREQLGPFSSGERLRQRFSAYSRILALFRLIYDGSHHEALPVMRYGGGLFTPGSATSSDPVSVALATFERGNHDVSDETVAAILDLLCTTRLKVRQGRSTTWVAAPVDFSDLSSEYIGILYEGLLDYELKRCADDDPTIFLALGSQPALPLSRLEAMDDKALKNLVEALKKKDKGDSGDDGSGDEEEEDESAESNEESAEPTEDEAEDDATDEPSDSPRAEALRRARSWARRAAVVGGLVSRRGRRRNVEDDPELDVAAKRLVRDVMLPGQWFLVRWGGTRKGHGTFYTPPLLTVPVVQRTLRPLAFDPPTDANGKPDELAPPAAWTPKRPADILLLKVCDPAMGSGSFLVAALRFLTDALFASLHQHSCIEAHAEGTLVTLPFGDAAGKLSDLLLPLRPDADDFELRLRARLKRFVLERCLYGVDIDPLAVELARLSLWVETMDRDMPFEFLRHKFKNGNSLIGCWFDRYRDYPTLAWMREGGDKGREGIHHKKDTWTRAIAEMRDRVRESLVDLLTNQLSLLEKPAQEAEAVHETVATALVGLHQPPLADPEEQDARYRRSVEEQQDLVSLREAFDTWCAIWFWPADQLELCPLATDLLTPSNEARTIVRRLRIHHGFFHWDLEFPDVFHGPETGFDAIVGNPPWEIQKPNSLEFFSNLDPLYRSYTKTEALARQKELFQASEADERAWVAYNSELKAKSNWVKNVGNPWGDGVGDSEKFSLGRGRESDRIHEGWASIRQRRRAYADPQHPCRHQGSADINTYKLFLEQTCALLRTRGRLGLILPSGICSDYGAKSIREHLLTRFSWHLLVGFINWNKIFAHIYYRFKFCVIGATKGSVTTTIQTAFSRYDADDLSQELPLLAYDAGLLRSQSRESLALVEVSSAADLRLLERLASNTRSLPTEWGVRLSTEFHMTGDAHRFRLRANVEAEGFLPDEYGRWISESGKVSWLPLCEGRSVGQFDFSAKLWVSGHGRGAVWQDSPWSAKAVGPQYLVEKGDCEERETLGPKLAIMSIASATNSRSVNACFLRDYPCNHALSIVRGLGRATDWLALEAVLNSLVFDWSVRGRLIGLNLSFFILAEAPILPHSEWLVSALAPLSARLSLAHVSFAPEWLELRSTLTRVQQAWRSAWAVTEAERLRLRVMLDAIVAAGYGLAGEELGAVLRDCDRPKDRLRSVRKAGLDPKGFWRVDKEKDPELRLPVLVQVAFRDLENEIRRAGGDHHRGVEAFLAASGGDGWMLPETLRLADYGLGHDDRAKEPQPVASRLGPRFLPWQLEQSVEESWAECARHARAILGDAEFEKLRAGASRDTPAAAETSTPRLPAAGTPAQRSLFSLEATAPSGVGLPRVSRKRRN